MLSKGETYFRYWTIQMKVCNFCFSIPYKWDEESERVKMVGRGHKIIYKMLLLSHIIYFVVMCIHMSLHYHLMSLTNCLKGLVVLFAFATGAVTRLTFLIWEMDGLKMINGLLDFEKSLLKRFPKMDPGIRKGGLTTKIVFVMGSTSTAAFGFFIFMLLVFDPCSPPYIGSMRSHCLNEGMKFKGKLLQDPITMLTITFDGFTWMHVATPCSLVLGNIVLGFGRSLKKYLTVLSREVQKIQKDSVPVSEMQEAVIDIIGGYMQLQLLVKQINVTFKDLLIPGTFSLISNLFVLTLYACVRLHDVIPMPGFIFFPMIFADTILVIAIDFASAGFVYLKSKNVVNQWKKMDGFRKRKKSLVYTKARSFCPLKIQFGMNYIDELTSFTVLD